LTKNFKSPKRGEIWDAKTGVTQHTFVIVSLDQRNSSDRVSSVLAIPFGSYGAPGPTSKRMEPGEIGLGEPSFLKAHFIPVLEKFSLIEKRQRTMGYRQMRELVAMVNRAIDPDAPFEG
jgi:hypothetical protein